MAKLKPRVIVCHPDGSCAKAFTEEQLQRYLERGYTVEKPEAEVAPEPEAEPQLETDSTEGEGEPTLEVDEE
jgi:hypothetical protein